MLRIKTKGSFKGAIQNLEEQKSSVEGKNNFLLDLAMLLNSSIQIRVQMKGIGADGKQLKKYSDKYAAFKEAKGRNVKFRDLTFSGNMWQSLTAEKNMTGARMFFGSAAETNKAKGNENRTPFFALGDKEKKIIRDELRNLFLQK